MNPRISLLTSSIILFGAAYTFALSARADDLAEVYKQATQSDTQLRAAKAQMQQSLEAKPTARARFLPNIGVNAYYSRSSSETTTSAGTTNKDYPSNGYSVTLTQPLYHADANAQSDQADATVSQAEAQYKAEELGLVVRTAETYFEVLAAQDNLTFIKAEHEAIGKQLEQTKQRFNVGLSAVTDVHESQARFDLSTAEVIAAENRLASAWEALRVLTGQSYKTLATLTIDLPLISPSPTDPEQWVQAALKQNPSVQASKYGVDSAESEIRRQKGFGTPTVDAIGSYAASDNSESGVFGADTKGTSLTLRLNWQLYQGGSVQSATRRATFQLDQAKELLEQQRRNVSLQTREAFLAVVANISRVNALKQAVVSQKSALAATEAGYEVGTRTTVDVLDARTLLFQANRDYAQTRYDYVLATLRLKSFAGSLSIDDVQQINAWLKK